MPVNQLTGRELIKMFGPDTLGRPSGEDFYGSSQQIANLAGGLGGGGPPTNLDIGTTYITDPATDTFVAWNTVTNGVKTTFIKTAGMVNGQVLVIKDYAAALFANTIQALEVGVTIDFLPSYVMSSVNGESLNIKWNLIKNNLLVF